MNLPDNVEEQQLRRHFQQLGASSCQAGPKIFIFFPSFFVVLHRFRGSLRGFSLIFAVFHGLVCISRWYWSAGVARVSSTSVPLHLGARSS